MALISGEKRAAIQAEVDKDAERPPFSAYCRIDCRDKNGLRLLLADCWNTDDMLDIELVHVRTIHDRRRKPIVG